MGRGKPVLEWHAGSDAYPGAWPGMAPMTIVSMRRPACREILRRFPEALKPSMPVPGWKLALTRLEMKMLPIG